ncbi:pentatricopeptide repeat-containing protein At2g01390 isoform X1 [Vigna unguiculata]|uniref:pentatricopeptide repeat-containing protein At2g01390 isoform X1 n=1 Tax=Vigna unguiculata TaxID=3917 RepID=UPI001015F380|nr:pentatricopeptide repeat-containing protein At2g01390 isoform X1 [Vigna unguiculata]XP_027915832.1 pentatricopeptide repeat-containing protein At2g01390 isoform X1 [Vigna unguiculata]
MQFLQRTRISKFHGFLRNLVPSPSSKPKAKAVHFLNQHQGKPKSKPITPFRSDSNTNMKKLKKLNMKLKEKKKDEPRDYMRNVIGKIYNTLKYSTWETAESELNNIPLKWDSYTVNKVLKSHPPMEKAWLFFNWASGLRGFKHDQYTYTTMLDIFGEAGRVSSMKHVFQKMQEKGIKVDSVTYTSMMHWLSSSGNVDEAMQMWEEMKFKGCHPTVVSYTAYMKILFDNKKVKEATRVYKEMISSGVAPNCHTYTVLMDHLIGSGKCKEALEIFEKMQEAGAQPDKAACNILIERCSKVGGTEFMTHILQYMKENRLVLRYPVFSEALEALKVAGESDTLLRQVNPQFYIECSVSKNKIDSITVAADSPTNMDKELLFVLLKNRNVVAIDHLVRGMMEKKLSLDHKVVSTIIEVNCSHCRPEGALLAFKYSVTMGISIERTGYLSLMGLLTRSNMFSKLVDVVEEMTRAGHSLGIYLASLVIFRLGCARKHTFAIKIFNLLPDNHKCTATYTALISVYFSAKRVDKALEIYKTMCSKGFCVVLGTYNVLIDGLERNGRYTEAEHYRKEKKTLHANSGSQESVSIEGKICNLIFSVDVIL